MLSRPGLHQASTLARTNLQRQNLCLCTALKSFPRQEATAAYSTSAQDGGSSSSVPKGSLFSPQNSPWDKVFEGIDKYPPIYTGYRGELPQWHAARTPVRRQAMTAREKTAFQEMFDMVFNVAGDLKNGDVSSEAHTFFTPAQGTQKRDMTDLFGRLRKNVKRMRWTTELEEELDRKKEEIELCDTDVRLLEWVANEVFKPQSTTAPVQEPSAPTRNNYIQIYPYIISTLMGTLRDKFRDPHLALAIFDYAKNLSVPSYVFGCTAPAYNQLIETRWFCFRDLNGVLDALEEMKVNGVGFDGRTKVLIETIRREAPTMRLLEEEDYFGKGQDRVMHVLTQIETLVWNTPVPVPYSTAAGRTPGRARSWSEGWKDSVDEKDSNRDDNWSWGSWGSPEPAGAAPGKTPPLAENLP